MDYESCKCKEKLVDKLIDKFTETIEEVKLAKITLAENEKDNKYSSCTVYIVLMIVIFKIFTGNNVSCIKFSAHKETKIW